MFKSLFGKEKKDTAAEESFIPKEFEPSDESKEKPPAEKILEVPVEEKKETSGATDVPAEESLIPKEIEPSNESKEKPPAKEILEVPAEEKKGTSGAIDVPAEESFIPKETEPSNESKEKPTAKEILEVPAEVKKETSGAIDVPAEESLIPKEIEPSAESAEKPPATEIPEVQAVEEKDAVAATEVPAVVPFEVERPIGMPAIPDAEPAGSELESMIAAIEADIEQLDKPDDPAVGGDSEAVESPETPGVKSESAVVSDEFTGKPEIDGKEAVETISIQHPEYVPDSPAETIRKTGMAYSAAIALFGSVVFMLLIGWLADLLLGIRPWGTVVGIIIGAAIGFMQFFSITSKIISPKKNDFARVSIANTEGDEDASVVTPPEQTDPDS